MVNIKLYNPYFKQKEVHKYCGDKSTFFISVNAGRQSGKSLLSINQALMWALSNRDRIIYWVSPTVGQATKIYKQMLKAILKTNIVKSHKGSMGDTEIVFENNSIIKFRSAAQEESLRGESVDYLIIDEAAFIKEEVYQAILLPMLNVRGKKCLIVSTPKGKNWYYYHVLKGLSGTNTKYKSFQFNSSDNPHSNPDIIELARQSMPDVLFKQEYLAEFVDSAAIFERIKELSTSKLIASPVSGHQYYGGVDIGMKGDYTVISLLNQDGALVYYDRFTDLPAPQLKERLKKTLDLFKPRKTLIELNNQGQPIFDDLKGMNIPNIEGFYTTSSSKPEIINNLINAFSSKKLSILDDDIYNTELEAFTMTQTPTGKPKFEAASGFHDDCVMSLAIGWECLNKNKYNGSYNFVSV